MTLAAVDGAPRAFGTIAHMADHRVRLDDWERDAVVAALRARLRGMSPKTAAKLERLADRIAEGKRGNPAMILGWSDDAVVR